MPSTSTMLADPGSLGYTGGAYGDPTRLWAHDFSPKTIKHLFKWSEYLYFNSAQIFSGVRKYAEYPITEISYHSKVSGSTEKYKSILEEQLGIRSELIKCSIDLQVYGNSFVSVHMPFSRHLVCSSCASVYSASHADFKYLPTKAEYKLKCPDCGTSKVATVQDRMVRSASDVHVIRWDPKLIKIQHNGVTNQSEYYLEISGDIRKRVMAGDNMAVTTMPLSILKAIADNSDFKFNKNQIFHSKIDTPAGVTAGWGLPPLTAAIPLFHHAAILRKANEAIALERIVPMRVMHPQATSGSADPIQTMSIATFMDDLESNLKHWRKDPNHIMMSPVAVGVQQVGGEGRALMVDSEIARVEDNIIASMGFPKEFVYGGLSFTGSSITLRMLENQLESSVFQINNLLQWIANRVGKFLELPDIKVELGDFKMVDDVQQKQLVMNLWQSQIVSKTTVAEAHGIDLKEEQDRIKQEAVDDMRMQNEINSEVEKLQSDLAAKAKEKAMMEEQQQTPPGLNYDQQAVIAEAENIAMQLLQADEGTRRSQLSSLQAEDYVMYAVVIQRMEQLKLDERNQMMQQGGGM